MAERSGDEREARGSGNGSGNGEYRTFAGAGFGTLLIRLSSGPKETPPTASRRAYLRGALPAVYQDGDFGMRFVGALEEMLDPIVAILDGLPAHFDPDHAPRDVLDLMAAWLGVDLDESQELRHQREMVRRSPELGRRRGTVRGLELALELHFPGLPLRVEDQGGVRWTVKPGEKPADAPPPSFVVYCDTPVGENMQAAIARCIEHFKPVHTTYRLRVKASKKKDESQ
jgi:phage tail-like protein